MKMVRCIWHDAAESDVGTWVSRSELAKIEPVIFHQVGYLTEITPDVVVMTACVGKDLIGVRTQIPIGMVLNLVELCEGDLVRIPRKRKKTK